MIPPMSIEIKSFPKVSSTNDTAGEWMPNYSQPFAVIADFQTAGRGRRGSSWDAEPGQALLFSLGIPNIDDSVLKTLPIWVPLALKNFVSYQLKSKTADIWFKWPNDIWIGDSKVSGVLCESRIQGQKTSAVIGIGLNLFGSPVLPDQPVASLSQWIPEWSLLAAPNRSELRHDLAKTLAENLLVFSKAASDPKEVINSLISSIVMAWG